MRILAVLISTLLVGACSDGAPDPEQPDAGALSDADRRGEPLDGTWALTWSCESGCPLPAPTVTLARQLEIRGQALRWYDATCGDCGQADAGELAGGCLEVAAQTRSIEQLAAYAVCVTGDGELTATISATRVGGTGQASTWRASGRRR